MAARLRKPMPPRIDATPEELAKALLALPPDYQWEYLKKQKKSRNTN